MTRTEFEKRAVKLHMHEDFTGLLVEAIKEGLTDEPPKHSHAYACGRIDAAAGWLRDHYYHSDTDMNIKEWQKGWDSFHADAKQVPMKPDEPPKPAPVVSAGTGLAFADLRAANMARLPKFKNRRGEPAHSKPDGSDWCLAQWANAVCGELGEAANLIKKIERGDMSLDEGRQQLADELADVQTYLDILSFRAGIDLGAATIKKFNEVSERVKCDVRLSGSRPMETPVVTAVEDIGARIADMHLSIDHQAHCIIGWGSGDKVDTSTSPFTKIKTAIAYLIDQGIAEARKAWKAEHKADEVKLIHLANAPFVATCGADVPNQFTAGEIDNVTCSKCHELFWSRQIAKAVAEEREACAVIAEATALGWPEQRYAFLSIATRIRARATAEAGKGEK